jgi:hypothetical protein
MTPKQSGRSKGAKTKIKTARTSREIAKFPMNEETSSSENSQEEIEGAETLLSQQDKTSQHNQTLTKKSLQLMIKQMAKDN